MVKRVRELLSLAIRGWMGLVPGLLLGIYGLVQTVAGSGRSTSFWLFVAALSIAGVLLWVAYQALKERDEAKGGSSSVFTFSGGEQHIHLGGSSSSAPPAQAESIVPESKRVEIARLVTENNPIIRSQTFIDKEIVGPAILVAIDGNVVAVDSVLRGSPDSLLWEIAGERSEVAGAIGLESCRFIRCRFINVGFAGTPDWVEQCRRQLTPGDS